MLAGATRGGRVFWFGLADARGFADGALARRGICGSSPHSGGLSLLCDKLLAALFVDSFSGEFSFLGCFGLALFLYKGGIWLGLGFGLSNGFGLRNGFWDGRFRRGDDGWCRPGSGGRFWFLDFDEA